MKNTLKKYQTQIKKFQLEHDKLSVLVDRLSVIRIISFVVGIVLIYFSTTVSFELSLISIVLFVGVFVLIVIFHSKQHRKLVHTKHLLEINKAEFRAINGDFSSFENGKEFSHPDHYYADDLDVFGQGSVFQYFNRTSTIIGKEKLASMFLTGEKSEKNIYERQQSVSALSEKVEWRQELQAIGLQTEENEKDRKDVLSWMQEPNLFDGFIYKILLVIVPLFTAFLFYLAIAEVISESIFIIYLILPLGFVGSYIKKVNRIHIKLGKKTDLLKKYSRILNHIENADFEDPALSSLKENIFHGDEKASHILKKLSKISGAFDQRLNMLAGILLNIFLLWDILQTTRLESWKGKYGILLENWFDVIAEFDALCSLGNFHYNHPKSVFPKVSKEKFLLHAEEMGHPLIMQNECIDNDITIKDWKNFVIITGANMAGKSTFLRTLGVNMILAGMGSAVSAKSFTWTPVQIYTSIRTKDSLFKHESYFFAELKRLKMIIDTLESGQPLFIILDEILKGTNSKDKQTGSKNLIEQLITKHTSGIIATHDLALGDLIKDYPDNIVNKRFEVEIINDELIFDYKLKDGISQNMNATFLMKKMGITMK